MESSTRSKAQELKFGLFSITRAQVWCESFTQVSISELPESHWSQSAPNHLIFHPAAPQKEQQLWLTWCQGKALSALTRVKCYISSGEGKGWFGCIVCFADLGTAQQNLPGLCPKFQNSSLFNYFPLPSLPTPQK